MKNAISTSADNPAPSLIKTICYPESTKFYSVACEYGFKHESEARREYMYMMKKDHTSFKVTECGLVIDPMFPFLGATPDGLVTCGCCGNGSLEIKCPFSCRKKELKEVAEENSRFFLSQKEDGTLELKQNHQYYYQVQLQMKLCNVEYCDFVAWKKDGDIFIQRIMLDSEFIDDAIRAAEPVIKLGILPELVARWFTRSRIPKLASDSLGTPVLQSNAGNVDDPTTSSANKDAAVDVDHDNEGNIDDPTTSSANKDAVDVDHDNEGTIDDPTTSSANKDAAVDVDRDDNVISTTHYHSPNRSCDQNTISPNSIVNVNSSKPVSDGNQKLWCYCSQDDVDNNLIGCDNIDCKIQWFHLSCVNLTQDQVPDGNWYCFDCRK